MLQKFSTDLLRLLMENIPMPVYFKATDGTYFGFNKAFEAFLGVPGPEITGKTVADLVSSDMASFLQAKDRELLANPGHQVFEFEGKVKPDGDIRNVVFNKSVLVDKDGFAQGIVGVIIDITERKQIQKAIDERNRLLQALFDNLPMGIFMVEAPSGRPFLINKCAETLLGRGIIEGATSGSLFNAYGAKKAGTDTPYPTESMPIIRAISGETSTVDDMEVLRPDGGRTLLEVFGTPVLGADGRVMAGLVTFNDITERRRMEVQIRRHQEQLERQVGAVRDLISRGVLSGQDRDQALRTLTETAADVLQESQASIWILSSDGEGLRCVDAFEKEGSRHKAGSFLRSAEHPVYFRTLKEQRVIAADDARRDPRTKEFLTGYLEPEGIHAMLDAPIRAGDRILGVFCNEHKGAVRAWTLEEQAFVSSMSDLAALVFLMAEQREAHQQLREARDYLDKIINAITDPIFVKDRQHRWVLLNDAYCAFMGYKREELLGKSDGDFFPPDEADVFRKKDDVVFETGHEIANEEHFTDSQGVTHVIMTKKVLYTDKSAEKFVVGIIRDVTNLKKAEEERLKQIHDLEVFYRASIGREQRIMELKARVQELEERLKEDRKA